MTAPDPEPSNHPGDLRASVAMSNSGAVVDAEHESFLELIRSLVREKDAGGRDTSPPPARPRRDRTSEPAAITGRSGTAMGPLGLVVVTVTGYAALAQLTFLLQPVAVASFFPAAGLTLALMLLTPLRRWPLVIASIMATETVMDLAHGIPLASSLLFATANAVEPVIAASLIRGLSRDGLRLRTVADLWLWGLAGLAGCAAGATVGTLALAAGRGTTAPWQVWLGWASGDLLGQLVVTSFICSFTSLTRPAALSRSLVRSTALAAPLVLATLLVAARVEPLTGPLVGIAVLGWAGLRWGMRWTARLGFAVTVTVVIAAANGHDFLAGVTDPSGARAHILHQVFLLAAIGSAMLLAAEVDKRHDAEAAWHRLYREARQARDEGRVASKLLRGLVDHAPAAISLEAVDGRRLLSNASHDQLPYLSPGDTAPGPAPTGRAVIREETRGERTYLAVDYPVTDTDGTTLALGSIHLDMTEQKQVMAQLLQARAALQARADDLGARNLALEQLDELKTQFVATVSHELRTPLTSICGYTELLAEGALGEMPTAAANALAVIERNSRRLLELIDTLLVLSSVDDGSFAPMRRPVDLRLLIERVVTALRPASEAGGVTVVLGVPATLPPLRADPKQIERMVANLVSNAVKFSPAGSRVRVDVDLSGTDFLIHVLDEGIGIGIEDMPKLFTRFHRAQSAYRNEVQGSGLGLAVSQEIAQGHGGVITVTSVPQQGSHFTARLPLSGDR